MTKIAHGIEQEEEFTQLLLKALRAEYGLSEDSVVDDEVLQYFANSYRGQWMQLGIRWKQIRNALWAWMLEKGVWR